MKSKEKERLEKGDSKEGRTEREGTGRRKNRDAGNAGLY